MESATPRVRAALGGLVAFGLLAAFGAGTLAGRHLTLTRVTASLAAWDDALTLGRAADLDGARERLAPAYLDPARALSEMDDYVWVSPNAPAPFLGTTVAKRDDHRARVSRRGFRGPHDPTRMKPAGRTRIILLGGSTAFSVGAPDDAHTIGGYLERMLALHGDVEVLTFATPAWASSHERVAIENVLRHLQPDVVISLSGTNDAVWGAAGRDPHFFRAYYEDAYFRVSAAVGELADKSFVDPVTVRELGPVTPVELAVERLVENVEISSFVLAKESATYLYALQPTLFAATRLSAREEALLAAQQPTRHEYFDALYPHIAARVSALAKEQRNLEFVDLSDMFAEEPEGEYFLDGFHFGDRGNERIAAALARTLEQRRLLPVTLTMRDPRSGR